MLLHGVGGCESDLVDLAGAMDSETLVVMPRGPITLGAGQYGWFRVNFTSAGPVIVETEAEQSRQTLLRFVEQLQSVYHIAPRKTVIAGFSQGGILSASVALSAPDLTAGFAVLSGRILPELEPHIADKARLENLRAFIGHGDYDNKLPVIWAQRADQLLSDLGVVHLTRLYPIDHGISTTMQADFCPGCRALLQGFDMHDTIHQSYASIRRNESPATPIMLLHIGEDRTGVASGTGIEPDQVLMLEIGASRTALGSFKHNPPSPLEIENAIMVVEDEVTRARDLAVGPAPLYSTDEMVYKIAKMAGCPDEMPITLTIEQVETLFDQLAARSEGRPSSQVDLPDDPKLAATLLILREFMHHLHFENIKFRRKSQQTGRPASDAPQSI